MVCVNLQHFPHVSPGPGPGRCVGRCWGFILLQDLSLLNSWIELLNYCWSSADSQWHLDRSIRDAPGCVMNPGIFLSLPCHGRMRTGSARGLETGFGWGSQQPSRNGGEGNSPQCSVWQPYPSPMEGRDNGRNEKWKKGLIGPCWKSGGKKKGEKKVLRQLSVSLNFRLWKEVGKILRN